MTGGKALVYGPVKDWGKGGIKVLLRNGEESRQYTLEGVTDWNKVERFRTLDGEGKLRAAMEKAKGLTDTLAKEEEGFGIREERVSRAGCETLTVKDDTTAERAIEIISSGLVIQDVIDSDEVPETAISSSTKVEEGMEVEEVVVKTVHGVKSWMIRTPRSVRIAKREEVESVLNRVEEGDEMCESDDEVMRVKSAKNGKGKLVGETLSQMVEDLGYSSSFIKDSSEVPVARSLFPPGREIPDSEESCAGESDDGEHSDMNLGDLVEGECGVLRIEPKGGLSESRYADKGLSKAAGDEATSGSYDLPSDHRGMWDLVKDLVANLKTIEEIELIKGGRPFRVRRSLAAAKSAVNTAGLMLDQGGTSDATGSDSWEDLEDEAMEARDMERIALVRKARRGYAKVSEGGMSSLEGLGKNVDKLSDLVATLAALNGIGSPEECEKARKLQARRQAQVVEARRAAMEVKKISAKEKEEKESKKGFEEAKLAAERAIQQVESLEEKEDAVRCAAVEEIEKYEAMDKNVAEPKRVAEAARRYEEAQKQIEKIEERRKLNPEVHVGKGLVVIGKKVHRTVTVVMAHQEKLVGVRRSNLQQGVVEVNKLLREAAHSEGRGAWTATASVSAGGEEKESAWDIGRVPEEVSVRGVLGRVVPQLVAFFGAQDDFVQAWIKRENTIRLVAVDAPMDGDKSGKELDVLLREENVGVKWGDRYPSHYGCWNKKLGVVFEVEDSQEAMRIVKKGIMWKNKLRKVSYVKDGKVETIGRKEVKTEKGQGKAVPHSTPRVTSVSGIPPPMDPKSWQAVSRGRGTGGRTGNGASGGFGRPYVGWSNVRCFGCGGAGHIQRSCTSRRGMFAPAIEYRGPSGPANQQGMRYERFGNEKGTKRSSEGTQGGGDKRGPGPPGNPTRRC
ncbi:hypothetical protein EV426DRAFT_712215 [Tirmania nivea]|nr:hypothetical protein EV426DRAFT_712215 [Tirmania nivea]